MAAGEESSDETVEKLHGFAALARGHTNDMDNELHTIELTGSVETCTLLAEILSGMNLLPSEWRDPDGDRASVTLYCATRAQADDIEARVRVAVAAAGDSIPCDSFVLRHVSLTDEDWAEKWKRSFKVERIGTHILVRPPWEQVEAAEDDIVVTINPGMAFGTGRHATTKACLLLLEELAQEKRRGAVLDAGCGSGIQSIAAAKLGFGPIDAFDNYPCAVGITQRHCELNGVAEWVDVFELDLDSFEPTREYDVVIANILYDVLARNAARLAACMRMNGILIASGVMCGKYGILTHKMAAAGLCEERRLSIGEWTTGAYRRVN